MPHIDLSQVPRSPTRPTVCLRIDSEDYHDPITTTAGPITPARTSVESALLSMSPLTPVPVTPGAPLQHTSSAHQPAVARAPNHDVPPSNGESAIAAASSPQKYAQTAVSRLPRLTTKLALSSAVEKSTKKTTAAKGKKRAPPPAVSRRITRSVSSKTMSQTSLAVHLRNVGTPSRVNSNTVSSNSSSTPAATTSTSSNTLPSAQRKQTTLFSFARPTASSSAKANAPSPHKMRIAPLPPAPKAERTSSLNSSLSSLSSALQRLNMPPPSRSSTSMGFNREASVPADMGARSRDDGDILSAAGAVQETLRTPTLQKAATVGNLSRMLSGTRQSTLMLPPPAPSGTAGKPKGLAFGINATSAQASHRRIFSVGAFHGSAFGGSRVTHKASKKTSLPSVEGSPVKGGAGPSTSQAAVHEEDEAMAGPSSSDEHNTLTVIESEAGPGGPNAPPGSEQPLRSRDDSRRASLASHLLSQLLTPHPQTPDAQPSVPAPATAPGHSHVLRTTSTSHLARTAPGPTRTTSIGARVSGRRAASMAPESPQDSTAGVPGQLDVLKECTIFVDVRTDDGDDAGGLFVDMLRGMGARILARVGQTCTHIVYKNGLMSTLTRYRLLKERRPLVVGIAWVVECAEQRMHVDETRFLINLDEENVAGVNKLSSGGDEDAADRIRAPSRPPDEPGEMNLPVHSQVAENGIGAIDTQTPRSEVTSLLPLEKARRRRSTLLGP
ncbi:hypothetical protein IEO21_06241 [Rhodonia placenta]|uniref:BRCT domain-containing protein n=1 Tax=Rhodonia placenta TaxID=104341 RepID=A0A8H7P0E7_9APHY|nr:hypothetical protein IEO21_06241 [Postia placenta]